MFRKFYKNQKRNLLRNWDDLNSRANNKQCTHHQPVENSLVASNKQTIKTVNVLNDIYTGRHYGRFTNGPWVGYYQLNFWNIFGLSAVVITGIRYCIEYENLKRRLKYQTKQSEEHASLVSYLLLRPITTLSNFFSERDILHDLGLSSLNLYNISCICLPRQAWLSILPETKKHKSSIVFDGGNYNTSKTIVPSGKEVPEPSTSSSSEAPKHSASKLSGFGKNISSKETSSTKNCRSSLSSCSFLSHNSSIFSNGDVPFSRFSTQSYEPELNVHRDIKSTDQIKNETPEKDTLESQPISGLVKFLTDTKEDMMTNEICNIATELTEIDNYERAIEIWNSILLKNPSHGKTLYNLATCFENGLGVRRDLIKAKELYGRASDVSHPRSCYRLARIHLREWKNGSQDSLQLYQNYLSKSASLGFMKADEDIEMFLNDKGSAGSLLSAIKSSRKKLSLNFTKSSRHCKRREPSLSSSSDDGSIEFLDDTTSPASWMSEVIPLRSMDKLSVF